MAFQPLGARLRTFCGEQVHAEFANLNKTSYCPACLLEDGKSDSSSGGVRVGRIHWQIEPVRTCEQHEIGLVRRKNTHRSEKFQLMSDVAPDDDTLASMVKGAPKQKVSDLQTYIVDRLAGETGPVWLDGQPIDLAARACEMLGVILTVGTHVNLNMLTGAEWNEAGHVGYRYCSRGENGVTEALQRVFDSFGAAGLRGGPQKVLGRLYQWLQFSKNSKPAGLIREVVREFILNNFPIDVGTDLFGEPVDRLRVHSAHSLAKLTGDHPKTINRVMVLSDMMEGDPEKVSANSVFDAKEGEALMERVRTSIPVLHLPEYMNCNRVQAEQLVRTRVIPRLVTDAENVGGVLKQVAKEDVDAFLERLMSSATRVKKATDGVMDIVAAAEVARWPVIDIVNGILAGLIGTVEIVDPTLKFKGILVDPVEVRASLLRERSQGRVGIDEGAQLIGMRRVGLWGLAKMRKPDGKPYVAEHHVENSKGVKVRLFAVEDLLNFSREHVSLKDFSAEHHTAIKIMKMKLDHRGVMPIAPKSELGQMWYLREDLPIL